MPNLKLETYKNKATGTVYDYTDAAAQAALAGILDGTDIDSFSDVETALATKVDKVTGKGLSTNDYDNTAKGIVDNIQSNVIANTKLIKDTVGWSGKNKGKYINQALVGDGTAGYNLVSGGSSLIAKLEHNKDYIVKRKSGQGDRFRVVLFINAPSVMSPDTSASQAVFDNTKNEYTISSGNYNYAVFTYVTSSSTAISQDTAEAMIYDADILDDTYEPYFGSTAFPRSEQATLGAKNLLYVTLDSIKSNNSSSGYTWNGNVVTTSGVEFTISTDSAGFVTEIDVNRVSGTGDAYLRLTDVLDTMLTNGKPYIMNGCTGGSINTYTIYTGSAGQWDAPDGDSLVTYNSAWKRIVIKVGIGANPNHVKMYPMIRLATDTDVTYAPYAMTNKELTEKVQGIIDAATNAADFAAFKTAIGNL